MDSDSKTKRRSAAETDCLKRDSKHIVKTELATIYLNLWGQKTKTKQKNPKKQSNEEYVSAPSHLYFIGSTSTVIVWLNPIKRPLAGCARVPRGVGPKQ